MSSLGVTARGPAAEAIAAHVPALVDDRVAGRLFEKDPTLWGPEAEGEASKRLAWVGLARTSRPLIGEVAALRDTLSGDGIDRIVLCGMGGSSLAPEVICAAAGVALVVLDTSHPDMVRGALTDLDRTAVVVSSKSGSTVETDSLFRAFEAAFRDADIDPTTRIVIVTDPGSPLDEQSHHDGFRVVNADPNVGGRYSALTAFGLVPAGLAGADIEALLDDAESVADLLADDDPANPVLRLGAALAGTKPLRDKALLVSDGSPFPGFGDWAEQLIAESTGKLGTGVLPVVVTPGHGSLEAADVTTVLLTSDGDDDDSAHEAGSDDDLATASTISVFGDLGSQFLLWEAAVAVAGRLLGINPFDQPDVESAKQAARELLDDDAARAVDPSFTDRAVEVRALGGDWLGNAADVSSAVDALLAQIDPDHGYVAVMAYLDRLTDGSLAEVAPALSHRTDRPVTFGWGPRFLHSTGQYHKGGPRQGVYIQITATPLEDVAVPGREFSFGEFIAAQAAGDARVLGELGRPVLRLHLGAHDSGLAQVRAALEANA